MIDKDQAASILVDASDLGDAAAISRHGISARTLRRYRERLATDPELSAIVRLKKDEVRALWIDEAASARRALLARMVELARSSPDLHDVAGAFKIVTDSMQADNMLEGAGGKARRRGLDDTSLQ